MIIIIIGYYKDYVLNSIDGVCSSKAISFSIMDP